MVRRAAGRGTAGLLVAGARVGGGWRPLARGRWWSRLRRRGERQREKATDGCRRGQHRLLPWPPDVAWPARLLPPLCLRIAIPFRSTYTPPRLLLFLLSLCLNSTPFYHPCFPSPLSLWTRYSVNNVIRLRPNEFRRPIRARCRR